MPNTELDPMQPIRIPRRHFISTALAAGVASQIPLHAAETKAGQFNEPARNIPLTDDADIIVCGAGPAGVTAAITAARAGAKVRLLEWRGCFGGVWTAGLLGYFLDFDKPGFAKELCEKLDARDAQANSKSINRHCNDHAALKLLLEELCVEAGVKFQFHTRVCAAVMAGRRSVNGPRGVTFVAKGRMLVLSKNQLLAYSSAKAIQAETIIAQALDDPRHIALGKECQFFISDRGATHQIKVFKATAITADLPSEDELTPRLWGRWKAS